MDALDIATLLAGAGEAVSPEGSWQQRFGAVAGETAASEQERRYLADLLGGAPDPTGRFGLDPQTIISGLKLKQQIMESQPKTVQMTQVDTPFGAITMPVEDAPDYKRKVWAEQYATPPSDIREYEWLLGQPEDTQKDYMKYLEKKNPSIARGLAQILAKQTAKQKESYKTGQELEAKHELGTMEHLSVVQDRWTDPDLSAIYNTWSAKLRGLGKTVPNRAVFREQFFINEMTKDIEDQRDDVSNVYYDVGPQGEGFYGTNEAGERILIQTFQRRTR